MAAPSWEGKGADLSDIFINPSFAAPVGTAANKVVTVSFFHNTSGASVTVVPAGFTAVEGTPLTTEIHRFYKYWKRLTGEDSGTYDFTLSDSVYVEGCAELYDNCVTSGTPFDVSPGTAIDNTNGTDSPAVSTESLGPDRLIIHSVTNWGGGTWTPHTGYTKKVNAAIGCYSGSIKTQVSAGSTGSIVAVSTASNKRTAHIIALKGTSVGGSMSVSDEARANMLAELVLLEPQLKSNTDLMKLVLEEAVQSIITETSASAAVHLERYLLELRNS